MLDERDSPPDLRTFRTLVAFVVVGAALSIAAVIVTGRFLYADSSYLLLGMWERGSFFIPHPDRLVGALTTQWMPALAMHLGWRDPGGIATLFGLNLWLNPALAVGGVWWASRGSREVTTLVLLCVLFLFQTIYLMIEGESSVTFWLAAILVVATLRRDFSYAALLLLPALLYTHVSAVLVLAPMLAVFLAGRRRYLEYYGAARYGSLVALVALGVALLVLRGAEPDPNRAYFLSGAVQTLGNPTFILTVLAFASLLAYAYRPRLAWASRIFWVSTALLLLFPFVLPEMLWPFFHYRSRALNATLAIFVFLYLHGRMHWKLPAPTSLATRHVLALASVLFVFQAKMTWEWREHVRHFRAELADTVGVIEFPSEGPFADPRSRQFNWSWTTPVRSVVFQAMEQGEVRALMTNAGTTPWQPFDPRVPSELPDLSEYGVRYAPELLSPRPR